MKKYIQEWRTPPLSNLPFSQGYAIQEIINSMKIANVEKVGWGILEDKTLLCVKTPKQHLYFTDSGYEIEALCFEEVSMLEKIQEWLVAEYISVGIKGLRIDSVMSAIEHELTEIKKRELFDKRFNVSKNISVLMYRSGTVEVHVGIKGILSTYKEFKNA